MQSIRRNRSGWILAFAAAVPLACWSVLQLQEASRRDVTIANLHALDLAIEKYSTDQTLWAYPTDLSLLNKRGYLSEWPTNPYTGHAMRQVKLGERSPGDFSYVVCNPKPAEPSGWIQPTYVLLAYSKAEPAQTAYINVNAPAAGVDGSGEGIVHVQGVLIELGSGWQRRVQ